jgi:hypothetical protein
MDPNSVGNNLGDGFANIARWIRRQFTSIPGFGLPEYRPVEETGDSNANPVYGPPYPGPSGSSNDLMGGAIAFLLIILIINLFRR